MEPAGGHCPEVVLETLPGTRAYSGSAARADEPVVEPARVIRWLRGDCRETLRTLEPGSVQACITSPPYYGLRDYGTPPLVWGGDLEHTHSFGPWQESHDVREEAQHGKTRTTERFYGEPSRKFDGNHQKHTAGAFCPCGAWLGSLGLEPTPDLFVEHLVDVFREVLRVLRPDGCIFVNLGDSYAGSGNGAHDYRERTASASMRQLDPGGRGKLQRVGPQEHTEGMGRVPGLKPKDLMMMPFRVAMALQADGWYLRSVIPWLKRNSMPESVTDRPATSVEYVFLLAKSARYYWDADAVRSPHAVKSLTHRGGGKAGGHPDHQDANGKVASGNWGAWDKPRVNDPAGRNVRNADFFFQTWQGLLLDEQDEPLGLIVNPAPLKLAHFASFPPKLVEPMVKASTSERGQCPECGAPWVRVREQGEVTSRGGSATGARASNMDTVSVLGQGPTKSAYNTGVFEAHSYRTTGWRPSCAHDAEPVPQAVLDCFGGSGTVGLVADRLGRNAVLCELSGSYSELGTDRLVNDAPLFAQLEFDA